VKNSSSQSRTCIYVIKHLRLDQWIVETAESDICAIRILTRNADNETQTLRLLNVYNSCSLSTTFTERFSIISRLNELLKNDCKQLIIKDFNLHHSHWEKQKCFTRHMMIDTLTDWSSSWVSSWHFEFNSIQSRIAHIFNSTQVKLSIFSTWRDSIRLRIESTQLDSSRTQAWHQES